ncbi:HdeD family acid-resistance protein [Paracoccus denitrificans]|uniref:HdeD family acid-resistance protein n=1 Tax=Paracoccus denitrificans TaxID=266 RepID=UPI000CEBCB31|nr:hypothetical protein [Paracoccus denitrificans]
MIRLILLLLGARAVQRRWDILASLGLVWLGFGIWLLANLQNRKVVYVEDMLAMLLGLEGLVLLAAAGILGFRRNWGDLLRGLCFLGGAFLVFNVNWDHNIGATIVFGSVFLADGILRILSALILRGSRLKVGIATGLVSILFAVLIFMRWPVPHQVTVPFCLALLFLWSGHNILRAAIQLRRLPKGASITGLPLYAAFNWQARGVAVPLLPPGSGPVEGELNVRIWTATGAIDDAVNYPVINRYVAAVDRKGAVSTGHAALELPPDLYISHYPAVEIDHDAGEALRILHSGRKNDVPGRFQPSLAVEAGEWCMPTRTVTLRRYNDAALRAFWAEYSRDNTYNLAARNCSTTVALALDAATEGLASTGRPLRDFLRLILNPEVWVLRLVRGRAEGMTWTPGLVLDYSSLLQQVLEHGHRRWRDRLTSALHERGKETM